MSLKDEIKNKDCINESIDFIKWLEKNQVIIGKFTIKNHSAIKVSVCDETYEFMKELIELYGKMNFAFPFYTFTFNVSTGEYYFLSLFSEIYSIVDRESQFRNVFAYSPISEEDKNILILLDEADLSLHPRWQKDFIYWITQFINSNFVGLNVQIIIATHSPILLSDFPASNVLYLSKSQNGNDEEISIAIKNRNKKTFGCNIHTLFMNSFFLENCGTLGTFAEMKINELADYLLRDNEINEDKEYINNMIDSIGEGIVKNRLEEIYFRKDSLQSNANKKENQDSSVLTTIELLKRQRREIDNLILELERKND